MNTPIAASTAKQATPRKRSGLAGLEYYTLRDVQALLLRRKWIILSIALCLSVSVAVIAYSLPNQYQASTLIMVDPGKVPDSYVKSTATIDANQRLNLLQEQILSDTKLGQVIDDLGLFRVSRASKPIGDLVAMMRTNIDVKATTSGPAARTILKAFTVSYTAQNAAVAAKVSNRLALLFIEENLKVREQQVEGTADFFEAQLQKAKVDLDAKAQRLAQLRARYSNDLPESQNLHLQALASTQLSARAEADAINQAEQQKTYLQSLLASNPKIVNLDSGVNAENAGLEQQLERLQTEMDQLRSHYGPEYPDVRSKAAEIQNVKQRIKETGGQGKPPQPGSDEVHNPAIEGQIAQLDDQVRKHEARQAQLQAQIEFHEEALRGFPEAQEQLTAANNDVAAATDRYKELEERKFGADMSSDVEARQEGERFVVVDPADAPEKPISPNRLLIDGIGLASGLGIALLAVFFIEITSPAVKTKKEIRERLGVPILGELPSVDIKPEKHRYPWVRFVTTGNVLLAVGYVGLLAASLRK